MKSLSKIRLLYCLICFSLISLIGHANSQNSDLLNSNSSSILAVAGKVKSKKAEADKTASKEFIMTYAMEAPPFCWEENGVAKGILVDIVNQVLNKRMGIKVNHIMYPWFRAQKMVNDGEADAFLTFPAPHRMNYTHTTPDFI